MIYLQVFFILKKNFRQVSFLHVYHHAIMVISIWIGIRYFAGGESLWMPTINCMVHVFMYTYYLFTALNNRNKEFSRLKKMITEIQLVS